MIEPPATPGSEDARIRALLEARSVALARRGLDAHARAATRPYLVCECGGERYGLPLASVAQVVPARACTPVPGAPAELLGLVALSGRVVSVLGLARALGRPDEAKAGPSAEAGHFLVVRGAAAPVAFAVDRVVGVAEVEASLSGPVPVEGASSFQAGGLGAAAVSGYAPGTGRDFGRRPDPAQTDAGFVILDLPRLVRRYLPQG